MIKKSGFFFSFFFFSPYPSFYPFFPAISLVFICLFFVSIMHTTFSFISVCPTCRVRIAVDGYGRGLDSVWKTEKIALDSSHEEKIVLRARIFAAYFFFKLKMYVRVILTAVMQITACLSSYFNGVGFFEFLQWTLTWEMWPRLVQVCHRRHWGGCDLVLAWKSVTSAFFLFFAPSCVIFIFISLYSTNVIFSPEYTLFA